MSKKYQAFDSTPLVFDPADEDDLLGQHTLMGGFEPVPVPEDDEAFDDTPEEEIDEAEDEVEDFAEENDDDWSTEEAGEEVEGEED